jgi:hypothetical protein
VHESLNGYTGETEYVCHFGFALESAVFFLPFTELLKRMSRYFAILLGTSCRMRYFGGPE